MAKYKIVATGPVTLHVVIRKWISVESSDRIISVAGVPIADIPMLEDQITDSLGRSASGLEIAVRHDLTMDDFDVEIVNG